MVSAQPRICPREGDTLRDFGIQTDHLIAAQQPDMMIINKKEKTCRIVDLAVPV